MGVLDPVKVKSSEMVESFDRLSGAMESTIESLVSKKGAIIYSDFDIDDPVLEIIYDGELSDIESEEDFETEVADLQEILDELETEIEANRAAFLYSKKKDIAPDYENPMQSWRELGELAETLDRLPERINNRYDRDQEGFDKDDIEFNRSFLEVVDSVDVLPIIEGVNESLENIEEERQNLIEHALSEHQEREKTYDRPELPTEPIDWEKIIKQKQLSTPEYMDIDDIYGAAYGDTLHLMMEEALQDIGGINVEQHIHFALPNRRAEFDPRPDVLDDLLVYDLKHMPLSQKQELTQNGAIDHKHGKSIENVHQINSYLHDLNLPAGILVYISADMQVQEYVVEKHPITTPETYKKNFRERNYHEKYIWDKENYNFDQLLENI